MKKASQPRIKGVTREPAHTAELPAMAAEIDRLSKLYGVSKSWVRVTLQADQLGGEFAKKQPKYYIRGVAKSRRRRRAS